jgi:hypothetical protein
MDNDNCNKSDKRVLILKNAGFLINKGFKIETENIHFINYVFSNIMIQIYFGRYSDPSDINIRFNKGKHGHPESFSVNSIYFIHCLEINKKNELEKDDKEKNILTLLAFIQANFNNITNFAYCEKMQQKINSYIADLKDLE